MAKGINNIKRTIAPNQIFPSADGLVDATISWKQGDLLYFDDTANLIKPISVETQAATLLGVALQSVTLGVQDGPYTGLTDTSPSGGALSGPMCGVEVELTLNTGDTVAAGDKLYATTDPTKVTNVAGTKVIGVYTGNKAIVAAPAGTKVLLHLGARFPEDVLRM